MDKKGEYRKVYELTRNGFSFLVNKMSGPEAAEFTEKFIGAFNAMEAELSKPPETLIQKVSGGVSSVLRKPYLLTRRIVQNTIYMKCTEKD